MRSITVNLFGVLLLIASTKAAAAGNDPKASGKNVVVCTIPTCTDSQKISNLARGITFFLCNAPPNSPAPRGMQFAYASITSDSGFQAQLYDYDPIIVDTYWIRKCNTDPNVKVDCWATPKAGCAKEAAVGGNAVAATNDAGLMALPNV
ncbi:hypothetical protein NDA11_007580 [Ustilago hordei]|uniref:Mig1 protein n=1 Tax=Ustilago hordei TaxID=120017 RepID=I2FWJ8_USTHO|nr:uncharacterized protein UHO2_00717 [Ustilago hordei]KAJ1042298.1 hypothetical protein NDA10_006569 [Ustilago hordei]KAJ1587394.1 hypothetical protein NDA15_005179 [Ustilago hordei]KAJ1590400.1 hypothetical protein NDA12_006970 [Ustilago hordei]KAJ1594329.1 hypothetical protein NDA11_007580 [Ustilago hordei]KAJ1602311.1 hypothetical protein NDA14_004035 [Ustilago hordei]